MNFIYPITEEEMEGMEEMEEIRKIEEKNDKYDKIEIGQVYEHWSSNWRDSHSLTVLDKKDGKILVHTYCASGHFEFTNINEWVTIEYFDEFSLQRKFY